MLLNPDQIISIEETPDTVITLFNGHHILVRERSEMLLNRIIAYRSRIVRRAMQTCPGHPYLKRRMKTSYHHKNREQLQLDSRLPHHQDL